jgi:molybdopterin biosynthesis enzyme
MDGYAVRAPPDVARMPARPQARRRGRGRHPFEGSVGAGEAARIFTGGVVPPDADTIVIQENTERGRYRRRRHGRAKGSTCVSRVSILRVVRCC